MSSSAPPYPDRGFWRTGLDAIKEAAEKAAQISQKIGRAIYAK